MMGMGNGRRGMKSPPLLIAVLLACIFVLTINYWITSSRCAELQKTVTDLESRIRRAAAERGAVELKKSEFEEKLEKQKAQIDTIQSLHNSQMQNVNLMYNSEKENLLNNLTMKDKLLQSLQGEFQNLRKSFVKLQAEYDRQQESQARKSTFELAQCSNKMKELSEQCEEKLRRATGKTSLIEQEYKNGILPQENMKPEQPKPATPEPDLKKEVIESEAMAKENKENDPPSIPLASVQKVLFLTTKKEGLVDALKDKAVNTEQKVTLPPPPPKLESENEVEVDVQEPAKKPKAEADIENKLEEEEEPKAEDALNQDTNKESENEEVEREHLLNLDAQQEDQDAEKAEDPVEQEADQENQNDYDGDEGNEAEPEAEKQAELIDNDQNVKDDKPPNPLNGESFDQEEEENGDDPILKK